MKLKAQKKTILFPVGAAIGLLALASTMAIAHPGKGRGKKGNGLSMKRLDLDGDGLVSLDEFKARAANRFARRMGKLDKNGDGIVSADEKHRLAEKLEARPNGRRAIRRLDLNATEAVTVASLKAKHEQRVQKRFAKLDEDASGFLDASELAAAKARRKARKAHRQAAKAK